jgi:hypothetical protein
MERLGGNDYGTSHVRVICRVASGPVEGAAADNVANAIRITGPDLRVSFEFKRCSERVACMDSSLRLMGYEGHAESIVRMLCWVRPFSRVAVERID